MNDGNRKGLNIPADGAWSRNGHPIKEYYDKEGNYFSRKERRLISRKWRKILTIDIETFCKVDLKACGLYRYVFDPSFEIILFSYKYKGKPVVTIDLLSGEQIPTSVIIDILDDTVLKRAHNAQFERTCIGKLLGKILDPISWQCTLVKCASIGLPRGLDHAASALKIAEQKDKKGKKLINLFCKPRKIPKTPVRKKVNEDYFRDRNLPKHLPKEWSEFKMYNAQDVIVEDAIDDELEFFQLPESEQLLWQLDQRINDRGVTIDIELVNAAVEMHEEYKEKLFKEVYEITGIESTNKLDQIKDWLSEELGEEITKLDKDVLPKLYEAIDDEKVRRVLKIRMETNKSSIDKYKAIQRAHINGKVRGLLSFYGAGTGRWSSKLVQLQNLLRNSKDFDLVLARRLVKEKRVDLIELFWGSVSYVLSQCIRSAFIPDEGFKLISSDFRQIESRVAAWVAGEKWKLKAFEEGEDLYQLMGARMFNMDAADVIDDWRQKAKIGELACGYQGGEGAIARMWPKHLLLPPLQERKEIVSTWRQANPRIRQTWYDVQEAAIDAVDNPGEVFEAAKCKYYMERDYLFCQLPSGRHIVYCRPRIVEGMYGPALECYTVGKNFQWQAESLYGGLLFENLVQGIARDILGEKMIKLDLENFLIVFHVHDENNPIVPIKGMYQKLERIKQIMVEPIEWAKGLPIDAETKLLDFYQKN